MSDPIILENLQLILESIDLINRRFSKLSRPDGFVSDDNGVLILDSITMRLQVIGELLKKIDKRESSFLKSFLISAKIISRNWKQSSKICSLKLDIPGSSQGASL